MTEAAAAQDWQPLVEGSYALRQHVRCVTTPEHGMLLDLKSGHFHSLNRLGSEIVQAMRERRLLTDWVSTTANIHGVPVANVAADTAAFIDGLMRSGLLQQTPSP